MISIRSFTRVVVALSGLAGHAALAQDPVALSLGGAARMAAERTAAPEAARLRVTQAEARVEQRRAEFLPSVSAAALDNERNFNSASFGISFADPATGRSLFDPNGQVLGPVKTWDLRGSMRQSIYDPGAFARMRAARANVTALGADVGTASQQAAAVAAIAYVRALRADAQLGARAADSTLAAELLVIARDQVAAGVGVALDVTRAQSQLSVMHSQLIAARGERDRSRLDLARALGLPAGTPVTLSDSLVSLPVDVAAPSEGDALARATRTRADLLAMSEQSAAVGLQLDAIRTEVLPALSLFADQGITGKATQHMLSTYSWGIMLSVPVFDGFRRDGRMDEQRAALKELDVRHRDLTQQAATDVRAALLDIQTAREQLGAAQERVGLAEQELAQARDRFRAGVSGNADAISASLTLNAARTQVVDARASLQAARVALGRSQGTVTELP